MAIKDVLKFIKDKEAEFVDLRFTDPRGKLQHLTMDTSVVDEDMLNDGVFFDGSSIAGWKAINESDSKVSTNPFLCGITPDAVLNCSLKGAWNLYTDNIRLKGFQW